MNFLGFNIFKQMKTRKHIGVLYEFVVDDHFCDHEGDSGEEDYNPEYG